MSFEEDPISLNAVIVPPKGDMVCWPEIKHHDKRNRLLGRDAEFSRLKFSVTPLWQRSQLVHTQPALIQTSLHYDT